jgi:hypothetical protein
MKRSPKNRLELYDRLLPGVARAFHASATAQKFDPVLLEYDNLLRDAIVFDCRQLPINFVLDTGGAAYDELEQTRELVRLPFPICYFEFCSDSPILAVTGEEIGIYEKASQSRKLQRGGLPPPAGRQFCLGIAARTRMYLNDEAMLRFIKEEMGEVPEEVFQALGSSPAAAQFTPIVSDFTNGVITEDYPEGAFVVHSARHRRPDVVHPIESIETEMMHIAEHLLLGATSLLTDKLLIDTFVPDPAPWWTRERKKKGKPPTAGDVHILTVNVPAVRYAASRSGPPRAGSHESPALHWRRGHWRAYHRGSEFEKQGWVRRCLVGDPSKGFIRPTEYRLTHEPPLLRVIEGGRAADALTA